MAAGAEPEPAGEPVTGEPPPPLHQRTFRLEVITASEVRLIVGTVDSVVQSFDLVGIV